MTIDQFNCHKFTSNALDETMYVCLSFPFLVTPGERMAVQSGQAEHLFYLLNLTQIDLDQ